MSKIIGTTHTFSGRRIYIYQCDICKAPTERSLKVSQRVLCFNCKKLQHKIKYQGRVTV